MLEHKLVHEAVRLLIAAITCWGIGCAGASSNRPETDFGLADVALFDNGLDIVDAPVIVEGQRSGAFEQRVGRADLIAAVSIESLSSDLVKRRWAYRLRVRTGDRLKGISSKEMVLRVGDDESGYQSIRIHEDSLLRRPWIAFVKWEADPKSSDLIAHWHLSPDSLAVRNKIEFFLRHRVKNPRAEIELVEP